MGFDLYWHSLDDAAQAALGERAEAVMNTVETGDISERAYVRRRVMEATRRYFWADEHMMHSIRDELHRQGATGLARALIHRGHIGGDLLREDLPLRYVPQGPSATRDKGPRNGHLPCPPSDDSTVGTGSASRARMLEAEWESRWSTFVSFLVGAALVGDGLDIR